MEQTASSMSVINVIFRDLRRWPLPIPPSSRPRRCRCRILWSLIKKNHEGDENEDEVQHKI